MNTRVTGVLVYYCNELQDDDALANSSATQDELRFVIAGFHSAKQSRDAVEDLLDEFVLSGVHGNLGILVFCTVLREGLNKKSQTSLNLGWLNSATASLSALKNASIVEQIRTGSNVLEADARLTLFA